MGFSESILREAVSRTVSHGKNAELEYEKRKKCVYDNVKRLSEIDSQFASLAGELAGIALSGNKVKFEEIKKKTEQLTAEKNKIFKESGLDKGVAYNCPKCSDTGYIDGKLCGCVYETAKKVMTEQMSETMPIKSSRFDNFDLTLYPEKADDKGHSPRKLMSATFDLCRKFADNFPSGENLLFLGGCGLGKTHLSLAVANRVIDKGYGVIYSSAQNLFSKLSREQFSRENGGEMLDNVLNCDLLIIDDLGTEFSTGLTVSLVYNIINTRLMQNLSTVISTNLSLPEIESIYSAKVLSRIIGGYTMRMFIGDDIRQIKAHNK